MAKGIVGDRISIIFAKTGIYDFFKAIKSTISEVLIVNCAHAFMF